MEPLTIVVGGFLFGFLRDVTANVVAAETSEHMLNALLDRPINHDIQRSLYAAWDSACQQVFQTYQASPEYANLTQDMRDLVMERARLFRERQIVERLFPSVDRLGDGLSSEDVGRLFVNPHAATNRQLITALEEQGLWEGLPGGLQTFLRELLLHGMTFHFVERAVKRDPKSREALFFQQLVTLRQITGQSADDLERLAARIHAAFAQTESYQCWQREVLEQIDSQLKGVSYKLTQVGVDVTTVLEKLQEIAGLVHGATPPQIILHYHGGVVAQKTSIPAMLRDRQSYHLRRFKGLEDAQHKLKEIQAFLHTQQCGYVFVTGSHSDSTSAVLAELIKPAPEQYIWCFINPQDNTHTPKGFLQQMCEQMLAYYQIPVQYDTDLPEKVDRLEALYAKLLHMPLVRDNQKMVLVIDNVNQAEEDFIHSLHIPPDLPLGKFIVFSFVNNTFDVIKKLSLPPGNILKITLPAPMLRKLPPTTNGGFIMQTTDVNPFEYGLPVPPERFYGRFKQRNDVKYRLGGISAQCISIVGMRRSGKSSLLRYIKECSREFCLPQQQAVFVLMDFQSNRCHTPEGVIESLRRGIIKELGVIPWTENEKFDSYNVEEGLQDIYDNGYRLIILIDEFESISRRLDRFQDWAEDWRSKVSFNFLFTLVIGSKHPLGELYERCSLTSNFPNIFTTTIIGALELDEWHQLVQEGFERSGKAVQEADLALINDLAGGLPFYTQMAASLLWQHTDHEQVRNAFTMQTRQHFQELWNSLDHIEQATLRHIASTSAKPVILDESLQKNLQAYGLLRSSGQMFSSIFTKFVQGLL